MSNIDIRLVLTEIKSTAEGAYIKNIYQYGDVFVLKLYKPAHGTFQLLLQPGIRVHLTEFKRASPRVPPKFCMALRKYLRNKRIINIRQHDLDRIIIIETGEEDSSWYKLVVELFGNGNLLLLDPEDKIFIAKQYKRMRDRDVIPRAEYIFPPQRGIDVFNMSERQLKTIVLESKANVVRTLASKLNLDSLSCQEICALAGIPTTNKANKLTENDIKDLTMGLGQFINKVNQGVNKPNLVFEENGEGEPSPIAFLPFQFEMYSEMRVEEFQTFSNAIDEFFGVTKIEEELSSHQDGISRERERLQRIIEKQQENIFRLKEKAEHLQQAGELIYMHFQIVQDVLDTIRQARTNGLSWSDILKTIKEGKERGNKTAMLIEKVLPSQGQIVIRLDDVDVMLDIRLSAQDNASHAYQEAKRARSKMRGAQKQIERTKEKLANLESVVIEATQEKHVVRIRKKRWYEKFRWFISSEGFLVLGGRDAKTNEQLAKRYLEPNDVFLHASLHGAPYVIIKVPIEPPGEQTLFEAAQFAVTFSRAWQDGLSKGDAYWVSPEQVSFTPPSGEYLPSGAVMIYGSKNYIKSVPVELAVGLMVEGDEVIPISGPPSAIRVLSQYYVLVEPGDIKKGQFVRDLIIHLKQALPKEIQHHLTSVPQDDFIRILPTGCCRIASN